MPRIQISGFPPFVAFYEKNDQPYYYFVNFTRKPLKVKEPNGIEITYPTPRHYFQAQKIVHSDPNRQAKLRAAFVSENSGAKEAKVNILSFLNSNNCTLPANWNKGGSHDAMLNVIRERVKQDPFFKIILEYTKTDPIVEDSGRAVYEDNIWGCGSTGKGENRLGNCLMQVRAELKGESTQSAEKKALGLYQSVKVAIQKLNRPNRHPTTLLQEMPGVTVLSDAKGMGILNGYEKQGDGRSPFRMTALRGNLTELSWFTATVCRDDIACRKQLICQQRDRDNTTVLHEMAGNLFNVEIMDFLFKNGAKKCWQLKDNQNRDPYQLALKENDQVLIKYFDNKVINFAYQAKFMAWSNIFKESFNAILLVIFTLSILKLLIDRGRDFDYFFILNRKLPKKLGPSKYLGLLSRKDLTNEDSYDPWIFYEEVIKKNPVYFHTYPTRSLSFSVRNSTGGVISNRIFYVGPDYTDKVLFYIPGTAFSVSSKHNEYSIASHLSFIHNCRVAVLNHTLAQDKKWPRPLNEICSSIRTYCEKYHPKYLIISGYSSGGLLAVLSTLILPEFRIKIDRLILFAPMLDMGDEMNFVQAEHLQREERWNMIRPTLPKRFANHPEDLEELRNFAMSDSYHNPTTRSRPFQRIVAALFNEEDALPFTKLRRMSPCWFNQAQFHPKHFPETTVIIGKNDYFRVGVSIFYQKLVDAGCKANQIVISDILPKTAHFIIWQSLIPLYLSQSPDTTVVSQPNLPVALYTVIKTNNDGMRVPSKGEPLELSDDGLKCARNLKENCAKLIFWAVNHRDDAQLGQNGTVPCFQFSP